MRSDDTHDWESESEEEDEKEPAALDQQGDVEEEETSELEVEEEMEQVEEEVIGEALVVEEEKPVRELPPSPPMIVEQVYKLIFIGPESDHWECLSLTHSLTDFCLVNLMAMNDTNCLPTMLYAMLYAICYMLYARDSEARFCQDFEF